MGMLYSHHPKVRVLYERATMGVEERYEVEGANSTAYILRSWQRRWSKYGYAPLLLDKFYADLRYNHDTGDVA